MQPLKKPKNPREEETGQHGGQKRKKDRPWILEYKWKSIKDYNNYPSMWWMKEEWTEDWVNSRWGKYIDSKHAVQLLKKDARNGMEFYRTRLLGKQWRVRHVKTGEIVPIEL